MNISERPVVHRLLDFGTHLLIKVIPGPLTRGKLYTPWTIEEGEEEELHCG
jgi:hypothetical protein